MNYPPKNWLRSVVSRNSFNPEEIDALRKALAAFAPEPFVIAVEAK